MGLSSHRARAEAMPSASICLAVVLMSSSLPSPSEAPPWAATMQAFLEAEVGAFTGHLGIRIVDPQRSEAFGFRDRVPMYLASGVKIAFMIAAFRALEEGIIDRNQKLLYLEDDKRDGAIEINHQRVGSQFRLEQVLEWMMRASDNAASDLIVDLLGMDRIQDSLVKEGIYDFGPLTRMIEVRRGFYRAVDVRADDLSAPEVRKIRWTKIWKPQVRKFNSMVGRPADSFGKEDLLKGYEVFYQTEANHAPMRTVARIFERMLAGQLVSKSASRSMLELMSGARTSQNRLLGQLPKGLAVAHKTGSQYLHFCDLGIVFLPIEPKSQDGRGPPLIVTMCTAGAQLNPAEELMAKVARRAYDLAVGVRTQ